MFYRLMRGFSERSAYHALPVEHSNDEKGQPGLSVESGSTVVSSRTGHKSICLLAVGLAAGAIVGNISAHLEARGPGMFKKEPFVPEMPHTKVIFTKKQELMKSPSDPSQQAWDALIPPGHGFVNITNPQIYGYQPGITTESGVERFSVAMFHQLHCLGLLRHNYWRLIDATSAEWTESAREAERNAQLGQLHPQHCFAYLAESIWCAGDLTIEWAKIERDGRRTQVDGWDIPHQCKDPDAILDWMDKNHGPLKANDVHIHN